MKKNNMLWINFLHLYQPANTDGHVIKEATEKSYTRIIRALEKHPEIKFTLNITGCLILRWKELGYQDFISRISKLVEKKQIELTASAAYHPALPLIPEREAIRQIKENEKILKDNFGGTLKTPGFFLPELLYSEQVGKIIKNLGYSWLLLDEISCNGKLNQVDFDKVYLDKKSKLKIVFRNRKLSKSYVPKTILELLDNKKEKLVITATDGELYGLRHEDPTAEFEKLLKRKNLETLTISGFIAEKKEVENISAINSNWESLEEELEEGRPYALWEDEKNIIQKKLWELSDFVYKILERHKKDENYHWARWHYVRGLASCTFWWASAKDFRLFGPISWSPDEIERGINEFIRAVRALENETTREAKVKAEKLYIDIKKLIWDQHWTYYWKRNVEKK